jgi:purine catabolism regulator
LKTAPFYAPLVVRVTAQDAEPAGPRPTLADDRIVLDAVRSALLFIRGSALVAEIQPGNVGLLLAVPHPAQEEALLEGFCRAVTRDPDLSGISLTVGVGMSRPSIIDAAAGFDEALTVARTAATLTGLDRPFFRSPDVRLRGLLAIMRDDPRAQVFAESELSGLLTPDTSTDLELLRRFLLSGGNKAALARTGYMSRPTLYAKLARLEERLGVDLADAESRTSLHVALLLHDLRLVR